MEKDADRIKMLEKCRESVELKGSRKEMTERVSVASKQFKVLDIDFGKEVTDRKELLAAAKEHMASKVRSDKRARYEDLVRNATLHYGTKHYIRTELGTELRVARPLLVGFL
jgi:hypothetical protein